MLEEKPIHEKKLYCAHYAAMKIEPIQAMQAWLSTAQFSGFLLGNTIKYLARFNTKAIAGKGGIADLIKARDYLDRLIEAVKTFEQRDKKNG